MQKDLRDARADGVRVTEVGLERLAQKLSRGSGASGMIDDCIMVLLRKLRAVTVK